MSDIKLLADEHIPKYVINRLKIWDIDIKSVKETGLMGSPDMEILDYAKEDERVVLTADQKDLEEEQRGLQRCFKTLSYQSRGILAEGKGDGIPATSKMFITFPDDIQESLSALQCFSWNSFQQSMELSTIP